MPAHIKGFIGRKIRTKIMGWGFELNGPIGQQNQRYLLRFHNIGTDRIPMQIWTRPSESLHCSASTGSWAIVVFNPNYRLSEIPLPTPKALTRSLRQKDRSATLICASGMQTINRKLYVVSTCFCGQNRLGEVLQHYVATLTLRICLLSGRSPIHTDCRLHGTIAGSLETCSFSPQATQIPSNGATCN